MRENCVARKRQKGKALRYFQSKNFLGACGAYSVIVIVVIINANRQKIVAGHSV